MGVGFDRGEDSDLVDCAFLEFGDLGELVGFDNFDGHLLFGFEVDAFVDFAVNSLAQELLQAVVFDDLAHLKLLLYSVILLR